MEEIKQFYLCNSCDDFKYKSKFSNCNNCNMICNNCKTEYKCNCELSVIEIEEIKKLKHKLSTLEDQMLFIYLREE